MKLQVKSDAKGLVRVGFMRSGFQASGRRVVKFRAWGYGPDGFGCTSLCAQHVLEVGRAADMYKKYI